MTDMKKVYNDLIIINLYYLQYKTFVIITFGDNDKKGFCYVKVLFIYFFVIKLKLTKIFFIFLGMLITVLQRGSTF